MLTSFSLQSTNTMFFHFFILLFAPADNFLIRTCLGILFAFVFMFFFCCTCKLPLSLRPVILCLHPFIFCPSHLCCGDSQEGLHRGPVPCSRSREQGGVRCRTSRRASLRWVCLSCYLALENAGQGLHGWASVHVGGPLSRVCYGVGSSLLY